MLVAEPWRGHRRSNRRTCQHVGSNPLENVQRAIPVDFSTLFHKVAAFIRPLADRKQRITCCTDQRQLPFHAPVQLQVRILLPHGKIQFRPAAGRGHARPPSTPPSRSFVIQ